MRQDEFYNLAGSESETVSAKRDEEEEEEEGDLWLEPRWNVTGPPQCPHMNERRQVNTTSWPRARQRTTKNHLLCSLSCCHSLIYWTHTCTHTHHHTHRLFFPRNKCHLPAPTSQRSRVHWAQDGGSCRAAHLRWTPTAQSDATVNKAKHFNRTRSRRSFPQGVEPALMGSLPEHNDSAFDLTAPTIRDES